MDRRFRAMERRCQHPRADLAGDVNAWVLLFLPLEKALDALDVPWTEPSVCVRRESREETKGAREVSGAERRGEGDRVVGKGGEEWSP